MDPKPQQARSVLMISCAFPPTGGPGVQRVAKFAKYLPEFGWRPIVWCAQALPGLPRDDSLRAEIPSDVSIHTHPHDSAGQADGLLHRLQRGAVNRLGRLGLSLDSEGPHPDEFAPWFESSVEKLVALIAREHVAAIFSTFSPASNHCLGMALKQRTGLPWLADFRDLWTDDYRYPDASPKRRQLDRMLEKKFLTTADVVIGVTPSQTRILASAGGGGGGPFTTITNGYDAGDFSSALATRPDPNRFVLAHVGRLDRYRSYDALFHGLERFVGGLGEDRERFVFRIVGHAGSVARAKLKQTGVPYELVGYVGHAEAIGAMRSADALLLTVPTGPHADSVIPAKLFEYLAAQRSILTVGPRGGECDRIIRETRSGLSVPMDAAEIAAALGRIYAASCRGAAMCGCDRAMLTPFERRTLTGQLSELLDAVVPGRRATVPRAVRPAWEEVVCSR